MLTAMEQTDLENQNLLTAGQNIQLSTAKVQVAQAQDQQAPTRYPSRSSSVTGPRPR